MTTEHFADADAQAATADPTSQNADAIQPPAPAHPNLRILTRMGTMIALVAGGVLNLAASVTANLVLSGDDAWSGQGFANAGQWAMLSPTLNLIAIPLMLLGIAGLLYLASARSPLVSRLALVVTTLGFAAFFTMIASSFALSSAAVESAPDIPEAVLNGLMGSSASPAFMILFLTFMIATPLGLLLTVIALLRSRTIPIWATMALIVFGVSDFGLPEIPYFDWHAFFVVFTIGGAIAVARTRRDAWFPSA